MSITSLAAELVLVLTSYVSKIIRFREEFCLILLSSYLDRTAKVSGYPANNCRNTLLLAC